MYVIRPLEDVLGLLGSTELLSGLVLGLVFAAIGWLFGGATRYRTAAIGPGLAAIALSIWLFAIGRAPMGIVVAVPLLALVGGSGWLEGRTWRRGAGAVVGSAVLVLATPGSPVFRLVLFLGVAAVTFLVSAAEESLEQSVPTAVLFAASTAALVVGIPEVDRALLLAGSMIPFIVFPIGRRRLGRSGAVAYPALFAWITVADGATAQGGAVGVLASLGILGVGYVAPRLASRIGDTAWIVVGQMAWALFASRVAGVRRGVVGAMLILSIGAAAVWWLSNLRVRHTESEVATGEKWGSDR